MLTEVMEHFGLAKSLRQAGYFETDDHQRLIKDLKTAIYDGDLIVLSGIVGCGKTSLLWRLQEILRQERKVHVTESLAFEVPRVNLVTLKLAIFYGLAMEKDGDLTMKPEKSERRLLDLIRQRERPVVLFVDDAHDLHAQTLRGLKQFMEKVAKRDNRLSVVLAGHPKLRNELVNRSTLEEIAARTTVFELEGIKGHQQHYLAWLFERGSEQRSHDAGPCAGDIVQIVSPAPHCQQSAMAEFVGEFTQPARGKGVRFCGIAHGGDRIAHEAVGTALHQNKLRGIFAQQGLDPRPDALKCPVVRTRW